jgi:hypothetical protein
MMPYPGSTPLRPPRPQGGMGGGGGQNVGSAPTSRPPAQVVSVV